MKSSFQFALFVLFAIGVRAELPKEYQVTGPVVALTASVITVEKGGERWEIGRAAATKVDGKLAVGSRVTVYYRLGATAIDVKDSPAKPNPTAPKTGK